MIAHVLCPGPSLNHYKPEGDFLRIGVNRAVLHCKCDWWVASDYPFLRDYRAGYPLKLFTCKQTAIDIKAAAQPERFTQILSKEDLFSDFPHKPPYGWAVYSSNSALVLAAHLGATLINVWGVDWSGTADFDKHEYSWEGNEAWRTRSPEDWIKQQLYWGATGEMLAAKGVKINRNGTA